MLHTQFYGGASGFGDAAGVRALQDTLRKRGLTSIVVSGTVDGPTAAAVYELIRDHGSKIPMLPQNVKTAIDKIKSFDSQIRTFTFGQFDSASLLRYSTSVLQAVRSINATAADAIKRALDEFYAAINAAAVALNVAFGLLPKPGFNIMNAINVETALLYSTSKPGSIYAFSTKRGNVYRVAVPNPSGAGGFGLMDANNHCVTGNCGGLGADYTEVTPAAAPPSGGMPVTEYEFEKKTGQLPLYKDWRLWAAIGGVVVVGGGGYAIYRRKKNTAAPRSA